MIELNNLIMFYVFLLQILSIKVIWKPYIWLIKVC
nr:MAG TPA: hypothetical protein [Caudoviricetes sp.]